MLADEPTGALDSATGRAVLDLLRHRAAGSTAVVLVTHDRELAGQADRIVRLRDGWVDCGDGGSRGDVVDCGDGGNGGAGR